MNKRIIKFGLAALSGVLLLSLTACESVQFYAQAVKGHSQMMLKRQDISDVLKSPDTNDEVRRKLQLIQKARLFAINELKLPNNGSYTQYADIERPYAVWNVVATKAYDTHPIQHCFPVAGCVSYRGYFSKDAAQAHADKLKAQGYDAIVSGAAAYSTLGWFSDPVLNTMLRRSDLALAGLVFHELAHQRVYQAGDTAFNESFAMAVELAGVDAWVEAQDKTQQQQQSVSQYRQSKKINADVVALILKHRKQIAAAYKATPADDTKRLAKVKQKGFDELRAAYKTLRAQGGGSPGYDRWFAGDLNNASLVLFGDYHGWLGAFETLLKQANGDWPSFYDKVEALTKLDKAERRKQLQKLETEGLKPDH
ncbi:aminopeptidase [Leucothrix pacifica]|uniref:Aminopeptidase n=1 Tax=Leucothrix pacifica TaxID=1247513 RepID=A0A317CGA4_9GAMM|nr:aminopeptidase [Leucothrix pacifica]PWQ97389.1 aminopeptidase [Leucothrix pacifica]